MKNYDLKQYVKKREIKMKRNIINLLLALFFLTLQMPTSSAASFDCTKAGTQVEKLICSTPILGELDVALSQNYRNMRASNIGDGARADLLQTLTVLRRSLAIVIGPTTPGTGVILEATCLHSSKLTSPTNL